MPTFLYTNKLPNILLNKNVKNQNINYKNFICTFSVLGKCT